MAQSTESYWCPVDYSFPRPRIHVAIGLAQALRASKSIRQAQSTSLIYEMLDSKPVTRLNPNLRTSLDGIELKRTRRDVTPSGHQVFPTPCQQGVSQKARTTMLHGTQNESPKISTPSYTASESSGTAPQALPSSLSAKRKLLKLGPLSSASSRTPSMISPGRGSTITGGGKTGRMKLRVPESSYRLSAGPRRSRSNLSVQLASHQDSSLDHHPPLTARNAPVTSGKRSFLNLSNVPHVTGEEEKITKMARFSSELTMIRPNLFISGQAVASDLKTLRNAGITHVVNCASSAVESFFPEHFRYLRLPLQDSHDEDISAVLPLALSFIDASLRPGFPNCASKGSKAQPGEDKNKVLVHCHQGVSRSCTIVIAYLMHAEGREYDETYKLVKAKRAVCRPNLRFSCDLLAFAKRRQNKGGPGGLFRVSYISRENSSILVCRRLEIENASVLDCRGIFLRYNPSNSKAVQIWVGPKCVTGSRGAFIVCAQRHAYYLMVVEKAPVTRVELVTSGSLVEKSFLAQLGSSSAVIGQVTEYDEDYEGSHRLNLGSARGSSLPDTSEIKDTKTLPGSSSNATDPNENASTTPMPDSNLEDMEKQESLGFESFLYEYPGFERLESFSTDDLFPDSAYILVVNEREGQRYHNVLNGCLTSLPSYLTH
ncbi:hypothetical protein AAMO2058_000692700 [Amorphochlora amoebiformis]